MKVKKMYSRISSQIFVWAGEEPLRLGFNGQEFVVPPRNETAKPGHGSIYRQESARDHKGELMPGTLLVSDIVHQGPHGPVRVLKVDEFCDYLTRDRDDLFGRGFNIVATPQEVAEAMEAGIPLYDEAQEQRARAYIVSEMDRRKRFEAHGEPAPPPRDEDQKGLIWAIAHLRKREATKPVFKVSDDELRDALSGAFAPKPTAPVPAVMKVQEIYQEAVELGVSLSKSELAGLLGNDPTQTEFVLEKIRLKREVAADAAT